MHLASTRALAIALLSSLATAQTVNFVRTDALTGVAANDTAAGDFDGDGVQDLAAVGEGFARVAVLLGTGSGSLARFQLVSGLGAGPVSVVAGDFTGDGLDDLAVACREADAVSILHGVSGALPVVASAHAVGDAPQWIVAADFDLDGDIDLATPNGGSNNAAILLGDGLGGFAPASLHATLGGSTRVLSVADCHADGDLDLIGAGTSSLLSILHGDGAGAFTSTTSSSPGQKLWVSAGDIDGDLLPDAIAREWTGLDDDVSRLKGTAAGTFTYHNWAGPSMITGELVDVTGDGLLDWVAIFTHPISSARLGVCAGTGTFFGFGAEQSFKIFKGAPVYSTKLTLATADLDANGQSDVVVSYGSGSDPSDRISVFLQTPPAPPTITAVVPAVVPVLGGSTLGVTGTGFTSLKTVKLGTVTLGTGIDSDTEFSVVTPSPIAVPLGPTTLTVTNNFGSTSFPVDVVAPDPPVLECPAFFGASAPLELGALPGALTYLAASPDALPSSLPGLVDLGIGNGFASLVYLGASVMPPAGWVGKSIGVAGVSPGTTIHFQIAALDLAAPAFPLKVSNVASGTKN